VRFGWKIEDPRSNAAKNGASLEQ